MYTWPIRARMVVEFYYHPQSPPSCAVWMVLKELGVKCKEILINNMAGEHKSEKYKKINPHMQVPALRDGEFLLSESRAIAIYLCQKYEKADKKEKLYPSDIKDLAKFNSLMYRDVDNYHKVYNYMRPDAIFGGRANTPDESFLPKVKAVMAEYDALLSEQEYIFGNHLTLLDFNCVQTVSTLALTGFDKWDDYPNVKKWKARLEKLPYFEECVKQPTEANIKFWKVFLEKGSAVFTEQKS